MSEIIEGPYLDFIFKVGDGPLCEFVEVEDMSGKSVNAGQWIKRDDGYTALRVFLYAQGQASKEARVKELEEALDLVIPRCVKCFNYATKFNPKKLWPVCDYHVFEAGGATVVIVYRNAIKATEALKKAQGLETRER